MSCSFGNSFSPRKFFFHRDAKPDALCREQSSRAICYALMNGCLPAAAVPNSANQSMWLCVVTMVNSALEPPRRGWWIAQMEGRRLRLASRVDSRLLTQFIPPSAPYSPTARNDTHIGLVHTSAQRYQYLQRPSSWLLLGSRRLQVSVRV